MNNRHRARRLALQGLCSLDVQGVKALDLIYEFIEDSQEPTEVLQDARTLLRDTWADRDACDKLLAAHAAHWELSRQALVDRNILRLAVHELLALKLSHKIIISEALSLAREFSSTESPRFINGVLDAVARDIAKTTGKPTSGE
ncbi:MAG: transcription antitermination factor NusB [Phycisphaerae bacterium]|nr:transcription antitermination factor NusB [Phycisphaerae bacterium]